VANLILLTIRVIAVLIVGLIAALFWLFRQEKRSSARKHLELLRNWHIGAIDLNVTVDCLVFGDGSYGMTFGHCGNDSLVYRTDDGGKQWQLTSTLDGVATAAACITSDKKVFALQKRSIDSPDRLIQRSDDGGMAWQTIDAPPDVDYLQFIDAQRGFIWYSGEEGPSKLYSTTDGGSTWNAIQVPEDIEWFHCAVSEDGSLFYLHHSPYRNPESGPTEPLFLYKTEVIHHTLGSNRESDALPLSIGGAGIYINRDEVWIGVSADPNAPWQGAERLARWHGPGQFQLLDHDFPTIHTVSFHGLAITMLCGGPYSDFSWKVGGSKTLIVYWTDDGMTWQSEPSPIRIGWTTATYGNNIWAISPYNEVFHRQFGYSLTSGDS